jgi:uncharacterized protein YggU (UPF0235/DUF167 family)
MPATIAVRVKPNAARARVGGCHEGRFGPALIVSVTAPAVNGRATVAVLLAVAAALKLRTGQVVLRAGATSRDKLIGVNDPPADLDTRVRALRDGVAG